MTDFYKAIAGECYRVSVSVREHGGAFSISVYLNALNPLREQWPVGYSRDNITAWVADEESIKIFVNSIEVKLRDQEHVMHLARKGR